MNAKEIRQRFKPLMSIAEANVHRAIDSATEDQYNRGMWWYCNASKQIEDQASEQSVSPAVYAGVVAALSPQMRWEMNIIEARKVIEDKTYNAPTYPLCNQKAREILNGASIEETLNGNKTVAFYTCLVDPLFSWRVAIDRHQIRVLFPHMSEKGRASMLRNFYEQLEELHDNVASELKILPSQAQAISWIVQRESLRWVLT